MVFDTRMPPCEHVDLITEVTPESTDRCPECVAAGDRWVHLRVCMSCGHVGCCDSSPNRHATRHAQEASHPIMKSIERGEDWMWCVVDRQFV